MPGDVSNQQVAAGTSPATSSTAGTPRVQIPKSAAALFVQPEVQISLENAAKVLGFGGVQELRRFADKQIKQFDDAAEPLGTSIGALTFQRLVLLCVGKTAAAKKLLEEAAPGWGYPFTGRGETVGLPAQPVPNERALGLWPSVSPESVGMDPAPLERLRQYMTWRTKMKHFAGIACGIVRNGKTVFYHDSGYADAEAKVKMSGDTLCRLFSMTKCLVAAALMTYVEVPSMGIDLDDPVSKYIPAFAMARMSVLPKRGQKENRPSDKPVTLRHLLTHTSGIGYGATLDDPWPPQKGSYYKIYEDLCNSVINKSITTLEEWCNMLAKVPLKGQPGNFWDYSYSVDVVGRVLEVISGKPLDAVIEERICGPLKMRDTSFVVPADKVSRIGPWYKSNEVEGKPTLAHCLEIVDKGGQQSGWAAGNASTILSGGGTVEVPLAMRGGMVSTFNDYLRFLLMLRNFGELDGVRVLKRETVQHMICNHIPAACSGKKKVFVFDKPGLGYNLLGSIQGQHPQQDRGTYSGEYGWGGLAGPAWTIDPRADVIVLSMTQTAFLLDHEEYLRYSARRAIHQHVFGSVAGPAKATSYSPECFDVVPPKPRPQEPTTAEEQAAGLDKLDKEFEEEQIMIARTRIRGAKERAICPGPRLDRHRTDGSDNEEESGAEDADGPNVAKRRRTSAVTSGAGSTATTAKDVAAATVPSASPKARGTSVASPARPASAGSTQASSASPAKAAASTTASGGNDKTMQVGEKHELLFTRVCVQNSEAGDDEQMAPQKARITAIEGDQVEVITEGNFSTMNVNLRDVSAIDETQLGFSATCTPDGPKDFGFLLPKTGDSVREGAGDGATDVSGKAPKS